MHGSWAHWHRDEQSRSADLIGIDDPELLYAEWAKFAAWRAKGRLEALLDDLAFTNDHEAVAAELERAVSDVERAAAEMRGGAREAAHYGG